MSEFPTKIAAALHEVMCAVGYVQKTGVNDFHRYNYASEADLLEALRPAMLKAGLMILPSGVERSEIDAFGNTHVTMEYTLVHKDGDVWPEKIRAFGSGNDKSKNGAVGDKGTYKAITGANKYLLTKLFQIETGDDPEVKNEVDDAKSQPPAKPEQTLDQWANDVAARLQRQADKEALSRAWTWVQAQPQYDAICAQRKELHEALIAAKTNADTNLERQAA